jgi:hypothetical protein
MGVGAGVSGGVSRTTVCFEQPARIASEQQRMAFFIGVGWMVKLTGNCIFFG